MHKIVSCLRSSVVLSVVSVVVGVASVGPSQVGAIEYSCYDQPYECYSCVNIPLLGSRCMAVLPEVTGRCNCSQEQIFPMGTYCTLGGPFCEQIIIEGSVNRAGCAAAFPQPQRADLATTLVRPALTVED